MAGTTTIAFSADRLQVIQEMAQGAPQDPGVSSTPLPPERPAALSPMPPASAPAAAQPSDTAGQSDARPQKEPDEPIDNTEFNDGPGTMLKLPPASHARMHQCAVEWQNMKLAGTAEEKIWFNFARKCLTR